MHLPVELTLALSALQAQHNVTVALEMWAADNRGTYPGSLELLVPHYLRQVPDPHWDYSTLEEGHRFSLSTPATGPAAELDYRFSLPSDLREAWRQVVPGHWRQGKQELSFRLAGPRGTETGPEWVDQASGELAARSGWTIEAESPVRLGELSGKEVKARCPHCQTHRYYLSDGRLGWLFSYQAPEADYYSWSDQAFVHMIVSRQKVAGPA